MIVGGRPPPHDPGRVVSASQSLSLPGGKKAVLRSDAPKQSYRGFPSIRYLPPLI